MNVRKQIAFLCALGAAVLLASPPSHGVVVETPGIGDFVWEDANGNGIQDDGEFGVDGVTVNLLDADRNQVVDNEDQPVTAVTEYGGYYWLTPPSGGTYIVQFELPPDYAGYAFSPAGQGGDASLDSNAGADGLTQTVTIADDGMDDTIDAGLFKPASIGNFVWDDTNHNGIQDQGEPGLVGVTVKLYSGTGDDKGYLTYAVTGSDGTYWFHDLLPGTYTVLFTPPSDYVFSPKGAGTADDSDANPITGEAIVELGDSRDDIDAGLYLRAVSPAGYTTYTQGGWGTVPKGNNPGVLRRAHFGDVYPSGVVIGDPEKYALTFTREDAIQNFLPQGGKPGALSASATNPTGKTTAGVFAGQVLALQLSVGFSDSGFTPLGLADLKVVSGPLAGQTVRSVLEQANKALGGGALPAGMSLSCLNDVVTAINENYVDGTKNKGYLVP